MKTQCKEKIWTFGDFVAGVDGDWGHRKGKGVAKLAITKRVMEFRGTDRFVVA